MKGILAFLVFLGHLLPQFGYKNFDNIGGHCVLYFFIISGLTLSMSYGGRLASGEVSYRTYLSRRFSRIYPIHWLVLSLFIIAGAGRQVLWALPLHVTLFQAFVPFQFWDYNAPAWFLSVMLLNYIMFPFYNRVIKKNVQKAVILWMIAVVTVVVCYYLIPDRYGRVWLFYVNPFTRTLDFVLGMLVYELLIRKSEHGQSQLYSYAIYACFPLVLLFCLLISKTGLSVPWSFYYVPVVLVISVYGFSQKTMVSKFFNFRVFRFLGSISLPLYLIHPLTLEIAKPYIALDCIPQTSCLILIITFTIFISWILARYIVPTLENISQSLFYKLLSFCD